MRVLGIDYGSRRLGLAVSDPSGALALPAGILERSSRAADLDALEAWIRERGIEQIVIGLPLHMDGRRGPEAEAVLEFARELEKRTGLPVEAVDERWTSREAERAARELHGGRRRRKRRIDDAAAALVLRTWLERREAGR